METYQRIPRSRAQADTIIADTKTTDTVLMTAERPNLVTSKRIPDLQMLAQSFSDDELAYLALEVIIASKQ